MYLPKKMYKPLHTLALAALCACSPSPQTVLQAQQNRAQEYLEQCEEYHQLVTQDTWRTLHPESCNYARDLRESLQELLQNYPDLRNTKTFDSDLMRKLEDL
jgi:hypothetical protein